jgi:glycosyltransferase involved in cell wall biosynthesis
VWNRWPKRRQVAGIALLLHSNFRSGGNLAMLRHAAHLAQLGNNVEVIFQEDWHGTDIGFVPGHERLRTSLLATRSPDRIVDIALTNWWVSAYAFPDVPARAYAFFRHGEEKPLFGAHALDAVIDMLLHEKFLWYCVSPPLLEAPRGTGHEPVLVPNGVDLAAFANARPILPDRRGVLRVLVEGPISAPHKRVEATIALLRTIEGLEIVHMAADGSRPTTPVDHALGAIPHGQVPGVYAACDILVKLSAQEAFLLPVLEQFAAGGTAVVARYPGAEQIITDGVNAILVDRDAPENATRSALRGLMADPNRLAAMRQAARVTAARFDWAEVSGNFARHLLIAAPRRTGGAQRLPVVESYRACALEGLAWWAKWQTER